MPPTLLEPPTDLTEREIARVVSELPIAAHQELELYLDSRLRAVKPPWRAEFGNGSADLQAALAVLTSPRSVHGQRALPDERRDRDRYAEARSLASVCRNHRNRLAHQPTGGIRDTALVAEIANDFGRLFKALGWQSGAEPFLQTYAAIQRLTYTDFELHRRLTESEAAAAQLRDAEAARDEAERRAGAASEESSAKSKEADELRKALAAERAANGEAIAQWASEREILEKRVDNAPAGRSRQVALAEQAHLEAVIASLSRDFEVRFEKLAERFEELHRDEAASGDTVLPTVLTREIAAPAQTGGQRLATRPSEPVNARATAVESVGESPEALPSPGQPWPYEAGNHSYSIFPSIQDVAEHAAPNRKLSDVIGPGRTKKVVEQLLKHRPEGGVIAVDADGDVSTKRRGRPRIYLGRVSADAWFSGVIGCATVETVNTSELLQRVQAALTALQTRDVATPAVDTLPPPGAKWPFAAGDCAYSLRARDEDVREYETGRLLSEVIGAKKASKVARRLLRHRPEGGMIRVDTDGDVSTQRKSGGGRFYLGRVSADEWFAGVIDA